MYRRRLFKYDALARKFIVKNLDDSAYSSSCSNSQPSNQPIEKSKEKDAKKKKVSKTRVETECCPSDTKTDQEPAKEGQHYVDENPSPALALPEKGPEGMEIVALNSLEINDEVNSTVIVCHESMGTAGINFITSRPAKCNCSSGFWCVISFYDGVVMYTTSSLTNTLGFPKDMWIGRSFIDFIHPRDRSTFAAQITSGLHAPKNENNNNEKVGVVSTMVCRIRRYREPTTGFGVKEEVTYMPFLLKLNFKNISDEDGENMYWLVQATQVSSAFKVPNEVVTKPVLFFMRHTANGNMEYIDPKSIPYLGYLPQDVIGKDALQMYHPDDLLYLKQVYETIVKEGGLTRSKPYRMITQNGNYIKLETEWSSFVNPCSKKLEFVIGKHTIIEGPSNPDVFQIAGVKKPLELVEEEKRRQFKHSIIKILNETLTKPAEVAKQQMSKKCQHVASFTESLTETDDELRVGIQDPDYERGSVLESISPHHEYNDTNCSTETTLSYSQFNYEEILHRYFENYQPISYDDTVTGENILGLQYPKSNHSSSTRTHFSSMSHNSGDAEERDSSCENLRSSPVARLGDYQQVRLTESLLNKHNADMEKKFLRLNRKTRSSSKCDWVKSSNGSRQEKKEHLSRLNASLQLVSAPGTAAPMDSERKPQCDGVKRSSTEEPEPTAHKQHCAAPPLRTVHIPNTTPMHSPATATTIVCEPSTNMQPNNINVNNVNTFYPGLGISPQMLYMGPILPLPMAPTHGMQGMPVHNVIYGKAMYVSPFVWSPIGAQQVTFPIQQTMMTQTTLYTNAVNPLRLSSSNYEEPRRKCNHGKLP